MNKVNFTTEHRSRLEVLAAWMLFNNILIEGLMGVKLNICQLLHDVSFNTLSNLYSAHKRETIKVEELDEWSLSQYQQTKLEELKTKVELLNLIIGYRKYNGQMEQEKAQIAELKAKLKEVKESTLSPEDKIKALEKEITDMGGTVE